MVKAVLFDLDGVLMDSGEAWYRVVSRGLALWGRPAITREVFLTTFGQGVEADRRQFYPGRSAEEIAAFYDLAFGEEAGAVTLADGALEVLAALGGRGLLRAVVTNTPVRLARRVLAEQGLDRHLEATAAAGEAAEKPAPDLVRLALLRLGVSAADAIYVGDSDSDRRAAHAAGVRMIGLRTDGDPRIESLRELVDFIG